MDAETRTDDNHDDVEDVVLPREVRDSLFDSQLNARGTGRLFVAQGKSRYINRDKARQVANLESILVIQSHDNEEGVDVPAPLRLSANLESSSLMGRSGTRTSLRMYHPSPSTMHVLWDYYTREVDVLAKILYKPSVEALISDASKDLRTLSPSAEAFLFAIWFAAVTAMPMEECKRVLKESKNTLRERYQNALEQALVHAAWMTTQEVMVLQALLIYIVRS